MRRNRKKSKMGFTFVVLLALLATFGASYAMWTENTQIHGTIGTMDDFNYLCLEGYWKLDKTSPSTTAPDSSMNENDGTVYGATWVEGSGNGIDMGDGVKRSLSFDGVDDYVNIPDDDTLDITDEITIMAWIKPASTNSNWPTVIAKWSGSSYYELYWFGIQNNKVGAEVTTDDGNFYRETTTDVVTLDEWQHLAMSYDSSTSIFRIYRNGNLIQGWTDVSGTISTSNEDLTIGVVKRSLNQHYFNGLIDEVKIYSCALSADDISDEYDEGSPI